MRTIITPKSQSIINYLNAKGYTKENPLILDLPITIDKVCECPGRYIYRYPHEVLLLWLDNDTLTVRARYNKEETYLGDTLVKCTKAVDEFFIVDDEMEPEDISGSFIDYDWQEIWYWDIDPLLEELFKIKPLDQTSEPSESNFFSIEENAEGKQIHIFGNLCKDEDWKHTEYVFLIVPLKEFTDNLKTKKNYLNDLFAKAKQGINGINEKAATQLFQNYFDGKAPDGVIAFEDITEDTPAGNYLSL